MAFGLFVLGIIFRFSGYFISSGVLPEIFFQLLGIIIYINIFLAVFNLLPIPPLDGSKIFADLFPKQWRSFERVGFYGIIIALFIAFFILPPIANFVFWAITGRGFGF